MTWGPIYPIFPPVPEVAQVTFPLILGTRSQQMLGIADATVVVADVTAYWLTFEIPDPLPTGTPTLFVTSRVNAVTGVIGLNIQSVGVAPGTDPDTPALTDEGDLNIAVPATALANIRSNKLITVGNVVAGQQLIIAVEVDDSEHTVLANSGHSFFMSGV